MAKAHYHEFRRLMPDAEPDDPPFIIKARVVKGKKLVTIRLTEAILNEAIKRDGQADAQNCGGAVCVVKHKRCFVDHPVSGLVDWWRNRVYIAEPTNRR